MDERETHLFRVEQVRALVVQRTASLRRDDGEIGAQAFEFFEQGLDAVSVVIRLHPTSVVASAAKTNGQTSGADSSSRAPRHPS